MPIKSYLRLVNMVITPGVWAANGHYDEIVTLVNAEVVHGRFQLIRILNDPAFEINWREEHRW